MGTSGLPRRSFKAGQARLAGAALSFALTVFFLWNPDWSLLSRLRLSFFDLLVTQLPAPLATPPVVIVDIDQRSLAEIGQWPWPRTKMAELVSGIAAAHPAVIGLDMVFAEPDRSSPGQLAAAEETPALVRDYLRGLPDHDQIFAKVLAASPTPVVLGHAFSNKAKPDTGERSRQPRPGSFALRGPLPALFEFTQVDGNLALLEQATQGNGFLNIMAEEDAMVRRLPLLVSFAGQPYPSLELAMLQAAAGGEAALIESGPDGVRAVQVGPRRIPTAKQGEMLVHFLGPARSLPYLSAAEILRVLNEDRAKTAAEKARAAALRATLRNAYVLIGATSLFDNKAVPTDPAFPGVEFHGHALNTILSGDFLDRPEWALGMEIAQTVCIAVLLTLLLPRMKAAAGALLVLGVIGGNAAFTLCWWHCWEHHLLADMITPSVTALLLFTVLTSINYFGEEKKLRHLRTAFAQYLAPAVVEELIKNQDSLILSGEERELSILFSDIRSFTSMAEKMRPDDLCAFLNEYLTPMTAAVMDRRGTVDKFIGDAVMAFWNAPLTMPDHVRQACECALAMRSELERLNRSWRQRGLPAIRIGIGIHCGLARVGNMGSEQRFQYTVIGDTVNLASRLEGLTKLYGADILVSGAVRKLLEQDDFAFRQVDAVRVVGKSEPVAVYQLIGRAAAQLSVEQAEEIRLYEEAFALYSAGDFQTAGQLFSELSGRQPEDNLCKLHTERCRQLAENPPPHWDGITDMRSK